MRFLIVFVWGFTFLQVSCHHGSKIADTKATLSGTIVDFTGIDGCRWLIELDHPAGMTVNYFEPVNLATFIQQPVAKQKVVFTYREVAVSSVCMAGKTVEILSMKLHKTKK